MGISPAGDPGQVFDHLLVLCPSTPSPGPSPDVVDGVLKALPPAQPPADLDAGRAGPLSGGEWAGYRIGALLGSGGMGEVYRAWQRSVGRVVALKVLAAASGGDHERRQRFIAEARAAGRLRSPQVVAVHDSGECDGRLWLAMELVSGHTLAEEIAARRAAGGRFTPLESVSLVLQAARGLAAAHGERLVHRDIKPGNLLIDCDGHLKVADFGLVRFLDERSLTVTGTTLGTPLYFAPEQGRGLATDARGDVYSLGVVLYELLTLRPPFVGRTSEELVLCHNFREPPLPASLNPDVPLDLQAVCLKCLQKDPARRFADGAALAGDLERLHAGLAPLVAVFGPGAPSTGADEALRRLVGWRRRWWSLTAAMLLTLLTLAAAWWWWDARKTAVEGLRSRLAILAHAATVPATAGDDLAALAALAGGDDAQVRQGRGKLAALAALEPRLLAIDAGVEASPTGLARARATLAELVELVGADGDPRLARWNAMVAAAEARIDAMRAHLHGRLDGLELAPDPLRTVVTGDLAAFAGMVADNDRDLAAWRDLLNRSDQAKAADHAVLARLDRPDPLRADELPVLAAAARRLAGLQPEDAAVAERGRRISAAGEAITARRASLDRLLARRDAGPATRTELAATLAWLEAHAALPEAAGGRARALLSDAETELAALRGRLAVLDAPRPLPDGLEIALVRYEALAGLQDIAATRWRRRFTEIRLLQDGLRPLDAARPEPERAAISLAALAALVGPDDPAVARWGRKLAAIADLRERLAALDQRTAPPAWAAAELDRLAALVSEGDPALRRWRARLAAADRLAATLAAWEDRLVLDQAGAEQATADLAAWRDLAGEDARAQRAAERLANLLGPPPPTWETGHGRDRHGAWVALMVDGAQTRLRWIPPGSMRIGSAAGEPGHQDDEAPATVRCERGFWLGEDECGQDLWRAVMGDEPARSRDPRQPVEQVSRLDAEAFCRRLREHLPGCRARLPSEGEWEYAVRAGGEGPWAGLDRERAAAALVHRGSSGGKPARSGLGEANRFGLHDGAGNLWEWCADAYGPPPVDGPLRIRVDDHAPGVVRGGSWDSPLDACRPANRAALAVDARTAVVGFRLAIDP